MVFHLLVAEQQLGGIIAIREIIWKSYITLHWNVS